MTAEEVLKIRKNPDRENIHDVFDDENTWNDVSKCIDEALEKQIPKKPISQLEVSFEFPKITKYYCPNCCKYITSNCEEDYFNYCNNCGQHILWGDGE